MKKCMRQILKKKLFKIDSCNFLAPIDIDKYLIKSSPTTKGTNYWDSPTEAKINRLGEREYPNCKASI